MFLYSIWINVESLKTQKGSEEENVTSHQRLFFVLLEWNCGYNIIHNCRWECEKAGDWSRWRTIHCSWPTTSSTLPGSWLSLSGWEEIYPEIFITWLIVTERSHRDVVLRPPSPLYTLCSCEINYANKSVVFLIEVGQDCRGGSIKIWIQFPSWKIFPTSQNCSKSH